MFHGLILAKKVPFIHIFPQWNTERGFQFTFSSLSPKASCMWRLYFCFYCLCASVNFFSFCVVLKSSILSPFVSSISFFSISHIFFSAVGFAAWLLPPSFIYIVCWVTWREERCDSKLQPFPDESTLWECCNCSQWRNPVGFFVYPADLSLPCSSCVTGAYLAPDLEGTMSTGRTLSKFFTNNTLRHFSGVTGTRKAWPWFSSGGCGRGKVFEINRNCPGRDVAQG